MSTNDSNRELHDVFMARVRNQLALAGELIRRPGFGDSSLYGHELQLGSELELVLVDADGRPFPHNQAVLDRLRGRPVTTEINRFNLEVNSWPVPFRGHTFTEMGIAWGDLLTDVRAAARATGGDIVLIGTLPTLTAEDLTAAALTPQPRYLAMAARMNERRGKHIIRIDGTELLEFQFTSLAVEGACTSMQIHLDSPLESFVDQHNAAQLVTPLVLAACGNSPYFLGKRCFDESRLTIFEQATGGDGRAGLGPNWITRPLDPFAESASYSAILPELGAENAEIVFRAGGIPKLRELLYHHSFVWRWNRAILDPQAGFRTEFRALPAGPTVHDMLANAALMLGATLHFAPQMAEICHSHSFEMVRADLVEAAHFGLAANLNIPGIGRVPASTAVQVLLPRAEQALVNAGVDGREVRRLLNIIKARVANGQTGAQWQSNAVAALESSGHSRPIALSLMLARYRALSNAGAGRPVHTWPIPLA